MTKKTHQRGMIGLLAVAGALLAISNLRAHGHEHEHERERDESRKITLLAPAQNAKWKTECSSCHMLYHPGLLPTRSWQKMMSGLDRHFGEDASLDPATNQEITRFLTANSADHGTSRRSAKILRSIPEDETPMRISQTFYFDRKHHELSDSVWKRKKVGSRANCIACHAGAERGDFSEHDVQIPR